MRQLTGVDPWFFFWIAYIRAMKKVCDICGGTGQVGSFQGESRFIISWEECLECYGTGFLSNEADDPSTGITASQEQPDLPQDQKTSKNNPK